MQNKSTKSLTIKRLTALLLVLLSISLIFAGCIKKNNSSTEPVPGEPQTQITDPTIIVDCEDEVVYKKPVIYLYPEELMGINVRLGKTENLICTYPEYWGEWSVMAYPNGDLVDEKTGRQLYSLYYECTNTKTVDIARAGFVVAKEDTISFLEEKLEILGLNEHESEEFIIYWLPQLLKNNYNYIRFASQEEINSVMPLTVHPQPDTTIRVMMYFVGLDYELKIAEQKLTPVERVGFTVVEWGGTELQGVIPLRIKMPCSGIRTPRIKLPKLGGNN